jgi:cytochrome c553
MKKGLTFLVVVFSLLHGAEQNDTNISVEALESNKSISQKATDLIGDITNGTKDLVEKVKDSTTPLVEETKESASKLVNAIKEKTHDLLDDNTTQKVDALELYKKCAGCHGSDGKTKALNKSPVIAGADLNTTLTKLQAYQKGELDNSGMGRLMTTQVDGLSLEELTALSKYIAKMPK